MPGALAGKIALVTRRRARHRPRRRAEARPRGLRRRGQLLQQRRRGRNPLRRDPRARAPRGRHPGQRRHPGFGRRDLRRVRQAFRPARHPGQQRRVGRAEADGRDDAEALALVHGNQRARAQSAHPARPAADARRRAHHRHVEPGRAAGDARLRLHRRVEGRAGVARARARAGARAARHPRQHGQRRRRRHRRARLLPEPRRAARELRGSARRPGRCSRPRTSPAPSTCSACPKPR